MRTLWELEREAIDWQEDARLAHKLAVEPAYAHDKVYWQIKGRKYTMLAIAALDACNIMKGWDDECSLR